MLRIQSFQTVSSGVNIFTNRKSASCVWLGTQKVMTAEKAAFYKNKNGVLKTRTIDINEGKYDAEFGI
ncbi:hypothetical protein L1276_000520 [Flavobacterium sp. HSC-32F16]|nr:hypothetical protein [Flavobacterium sp. HSC-32F16]